MNNEPNDNENIRSPTEKRSVVVGVRREQVLGNDPLDPLSSPTPTPPNYSSEEPAVPSNSNIDISKPSQAPSLSKYSQQTDYLVPPPPAPVGVSQIYDSLRQPMDKIDQMAAIIVSPSGHTSSKISRSVDIVSMTSSSSSIANAE